MNFEEMLIMKISELVYDLSPYATEYVSKRLASLRRNSSPDLLPAIADESKEVARACGILINETQVLRGADAGKLDWRYRAQLSGTAGNELMDMAGVNPRVVESLGGKGGDLALDLDINYFGAILDAQFIAEINNSQPSSELVAAVNAMGRVVDSAPEKYPTLENFTGKISISQIQQREYMAKQENTPPRYQSPGYRDKPKPPFNPNAYILSNRPL
jgi:hypothetical protein